MPTLNFAEIYSSLKGDFTTLILFGSYARGDQSSKSDLDILQVTDLDLKSYSFVLGELKVNVSVYKPEVLEKRAKNGDSFVCHILNEGLVLRDDGFVNRLHSLWEKPSKPDRKWLIATFHRLCVKSHVYYNNSSDFMRSLLYILRSFLYQEEAQRDKPTFSIKEIEKSRNIPGLVDVCNELKAKTPSHYSYCQILTFVSKIFGLASWSYCDDEDAFFPDFGSYEL